MKHAQNIHIKEIQYRILYNSQDKIISLGTDESNYKISFFNIKNVIYCIKRMLKKKGKPEDEKIYK